MGSGIRILAMAKRSLSGNPDNRLNSPPEFPCGFARPKSAGEVKTHLAVFHRRAKRNGLPMVARGIRDFQRNWPPVDSLLVLVAEIENTLRSRALFVFLGGLNSAESGQGDFQIAIGSRRLRIEQPFLS
jgi:hypothetical protein